MTSTVEKHDEQVTPPTRPRDTATLYFNPTLDGTSKPSLEGQWWGASLTPQQTIAAERGVF